MTGSALRKEVCSKKTVRQAGQWGGGVPKSTVNIYFRAKRGKNEKRKWGVRSRHVWGRREGPQCGRTGKRKRAWASIIKKRNKNKERGEDYSSLGEEISRFGETSS